MKQGPAAMANKKQDNLDQVHWEWGSRNIKIFFFLEEEHLKNSETCPGPYLFTQYMITTVPIHLLTQAL